MLYPNRAQDISHAACPPPRATFSPYSTDGVARERGSTLTHLLLSNVTSPNGTQSAPTALYTIRRVHERRTLSLSCKIYFPRLFPGALSTEGLHRRSGLAEKIGHPHDGGDDAAQGHRAAPPPAIRPVQGGVLVRPPPLVLRVRVVVPRQRGANARGVLHGVPGLGRELLSDTGMPSRGVCVCVFIKLHITAQSGPVILVIICHSH